MKIGIIGAMEVEVTRLKEQLNDVQIVKKAGMEFCQGTYLNQQLVVVRSGIGKVNAAICAQILIDEFQVDAMMNTGIAGSLNNEINIGDIVISKDVLHHDMDATGFGYDLGVIPQMSCSIFEADETLIQLASKVCKDVNPDITSHIGRIVSGDQFISGTEKKQWLIDTFRGYCAEMEGAAIAQVCFLNEIPFVIIRAISDKADQSATMDYPQFEKQAAEHAVNLVNGMIAKL